MPSMPDTELPLGYGTFDDYLAALPAKPRRNARNKLRKFHARDDLRIEVLTDFAELVPDMLELYRQVMDRADQTLDVLDESFLHALQRPGGPDQRLVACFEDDRLVAFLHCLFRGEGAIGARIGLDYRLAHEARLYHNVHYAAIELAIARKCSAHPVRPDRIRAQTGARLRTGRPAVRHDPCEPTAPRGAAPAAPARAQHGARPDARAPLVSTPPHHNVESRSSCPVSK
ncbi:hypothetical protein GCM10020000_02930 [Streptomyces olivoverticillatus]